MLSPPGPAASFAISFSDFAQNEQWSNSAMIDSLPEQASPGQAGGAGAISGESAPSEVSADAANAWASAIFVKCRS